MLGRLLLMGLAALAVTSIVVYISGLLNKKKTQDVMRDKAIKNGLIKQIDRCNNVLTLEDLNSGNTYELKGADSIDYDLYEGQTIYA